MKAAEARVAAAEAQGVQWKNVRALASCSDGGGGDGVAWDAWGGWAGGQRRVVVLRWGRSVPSL